MKSMVDERTKGGLFQNLFEFASRVDLMSVNKTTLESLICAGAMDNLEGFRAQKYGSIEIALEYASSVQKEKKRGQFTLFEAFQDENEEDSYLPELPKIQEWGPNKLWEKEKEVLGFSFSPNPLKQHEKMLNLLTNVTTEKAEYEPEKIPSIIYIAGIVAEVIRKKDRRGNAFAIVMMEDLTGKFEILLFKDDFDKYIQIMKESTQLYVVGKKSTYNSNDGIIRIIPTMIVEFKNMRNALSGDLYLKLSEKDATSLFAKEIIKLAKTNSGKFGLHISVETDKFKLLNLLARNYKIFPNVALLDVFEGKLIGNPKIVFGY